VSTTPTGRAPATWFFTAVGLLLLAVGVGVGWWWWSPREPAELVDGVATTSGPDDFAAVGDAVFSALAAAAGFVSGLAVVLRPGQSAVTRASVVVVGGFVAALAGWQLGVLLGPPSLAAQQAAGLDPLTTPVALSSVVPLLMWPATCTATLFIGLLFSLMLRPPEYPV
jgi:hypothetical protein